MAAAKYRILHLPHSGPALNTCIRKYRDLKLYALHNSPGGLRGDYAKESKLPLSHFEGHLVDPSRNTFIAVHVPREDAPDVLVEREWVCMSYFFGPLPASQYTWGYTGNLRSDKEETRWASHGAYAKPPHRGMDPSLLKLCYDAGQRYRVAETRRLLGPQAFAEGRDKVFVRLRSAVVARNDGLVGYFVKNMGFNFAGNVEVEASYTAQRLGYELTKSAIPCVALEKVVEIDLSKEAGSPGEVVLAKL